jgi:peptidoglycan/LPS O-acetylase OafA/YrhL
VALACGPSCLFSGSKRRVEGFHFPGGARQPTPRMTDASNRGESLVIFPVLCRFFYNHSGLSSVDSGIRLLALHFQTVRAFRVAKTNLFFVISGFCIHLSHVRSREQNFRRFFIRRFSRIYPAYLFCVLIFFFVPPWSSISATSLSGGAQLASHLLLLQNFDDRTLFGINPSFWSIAVEVQLYLLYPLLLALVSRLGWKRTLLILATLELSLRSLERHIKYYQGKALLYG